MSNTPVRGAVPTFGVLAVAFALSAGCATTPRGGDHAPPPISATSGRAVDQAGREPMAAEEARATVALTAAERSDLGLPQLGEAVDAKALAPLANAQWADPGAVSARLALLQTNYRASEAQDDVRARWLPYLVPRLAEDLAGSDAGAAALAELRTRDAVFVGVVLGLDVNEQSQDRAVVSLTIRRSVVSVGGPIQPPRVAFWVLTVVRDLATGRWLVAQLDRS